MNVDKKPDKIEVTAVAADGGTVIIRVIVDNESYDLYVDRRIGTETYDEVYSSYPGGTDSMMLDPGTVLVSIVKGFLTE